jgi:hypothetical protein
MAADYPLSQEVDFGEITARHQIWNDGEIMAVSAVNVEKR